MTDSISGAPPGLRAGSFTVRPAGPGTGFSTWHHRPRRGSVRPDKETP
jgi:hypothetical protein